MASKCMQNTCHACPSRVLFIFITQSMQSFAHYFHSSLRSSYWNGVQNGIGGHGVHCSLLPALCILFPAFLLQLSRLTCLINGRSCQEAALFVLLNLQATDWESSPPPLSPGYIESMNYEFELRPACSSIRRRRNRYADQLPMVYSYKLFALTDNICSPVLPLPPSL